MHGRTYVDFKRFTVRLKFVGKCDVISEETVAGHLSSHYTRHNRTSMKTNSHLYGDRHRFRKSIENLGLFAIRRMRNGCLRWSELHVASKAGGDSNTTQGHI